ncbi:hypothetical protein HDV05_006364 [Chytridiales sp. JEL 0842]|nr:hypothetical protein HDV05_006364 [Chytridiales sp. JEL 0842]
MADSKPESNRILALEKQREKMYAEIQKRKEEIRKETTVKAPTSAKFTSQQESLQSELIKHTVGLVKLEDFQKIKASLDEKRREEVERGLEAMKEKEGKGGKKKRKVGKAKLSFDLDEDAEENEDAEAEVEMKKKKKVDQDAEEDGGAISKPKSLKNPHVDTSFLPDKEREAAEAREREVLKLEWLKQQEKIKNERIQITYSYWDGTGHRKMVECKKGDTIAHFLELCRQEQHELRSVNVENMIYVKEDLIIPHHYTFYDFIVNQTRGKSGPLFSFDVHDDVRLTNDASVETEESHAGKVMTRAWYEKNKHIFPASRWEVFDPSKVFDKYTIKDKNKKK